MPARSVSLDGRIKRLFDPLRPPEPVTDLPIQDTEPSYVLVSAGDQSLLNEPAANEEWKCIDVLVGYECCEGRQALFAFQLRLRSVFLLLSSQSGNLLLLLEWVKLLPS